MPTYEYECNSCGNTVEVFQQITEPPLMDCPRCNEGSLRRLFGKNVNLIFKGSGFYITDYRSEEYKRREKEEKGEKTPKKESIAPKEKREDSLSPSA
ncbi:TPA: FmdB family transcriptional regulator [bacterium]|nr:FmdB family transcriptional regulator [bacterium]